MNNPITVTVGVILVLFLLWQYRHHIKQLVTDMIKQVQLRNYLAGHERRKISELKTNHNMLIDHSDNAILKGAYHCLSRTSIKRQENKIEIVVPIQNYPELQAYVEAKLEQHLITWLEGNYPGRHWKTKPKLEKTLFGWKDILAEK